VSEQSVAFIPPAVALLAPTFEDTTTITTTGASPFTFARPRPSNFFLFPFFTMTAQMASHGRGGAGNMAKADGSPKITPADLETPTLKKPVVTTGRGGTGNMAKNKDPVETRLRQDVEGVPRRPSTGAQHAGRGGAGNVFKGRDAETDAAESAVDDSSDSATAPPKGKGWFFKKA
jgi:hypothetical protein